MFEHYQVVAYVIGRRLHGPGLTFLILWIMTACLRSCMDSYCRRSVTIIILTVERAADKVRGIIRNKNRHMHTYCEGGRLIKSSLLTWNWCAIHVILTRDQTGCYFQFFIALAVENQQLLHYITLTSSWPLHYAYEWYSENAVWLSDNFTAGAPFG